MQYSEICELLIWSTSGENDAYLCFPWLFKVAASEECKPNTATVNLSVQRESETQRHYIGRMNDMCTGRTTTHVKKSRDIRNLCQAEDAGDPSTVVSSCCFMNPRCAAAPSLADVHKIIFLKIRQFPTTLNATDYMQYGCSTVYLLVYRLFTLWLDLHTEQRACEDRTTTRMNSLSERTPPTPLRCLRFEWRNCLQALSLITLTIIRTGGATRFWQMTVQCFPIRY